MLIFWAMGIVAFLLAQEGEGKKKEMLVKLSGGSSIDLCAIGEIHQKIGSYNYVINFCDVIKMKGCEGAHVCQFQGKDAVSMGKVPTIQGDSILFSEGSKGCGEKRRQSLILIKNGSTPQIESISEFQKCEYDINFQHPSGSECSVALYRQAGSNDCGLHGKGYGCFGNFMWVRGCKGDFICNNKKIRCHSSAGKREQCACNRTATRFKYGSAQS